MSNKIKKLVSRIYTSISFWQQESKNLENEEIEKIAKDTMGKYHKTFEDLAKYDRGERRASKIPK